MNPSAQAAGATIVSLLLILLISAPIGASTETAVTLQVTDVLAKPSSAYDSGTAKVEFRILSGDYRGKTFTYNHQLWGNPNYDPDFREEAVFAGRITIDNDNILRLELGQERKSYTLVLLFVGLSIALVLLAGWEGLLGLLCSLLTLGGIFYGFFPYALGARLVLPAGIVLCVLTVIGTVPLILRFSRPTLPAVASLLVTTGFLFGLSEWGLHFLKLDPALARHSRLILTHLNRFVADGTHVLRSLLVSGIVLGTLGAMMDVAVVISSTIHEITRDTDRLSFKESFTSGITVGREILSTMVNTLIFAYLGILIPVLLAFQVFDLTWIRFLNYPFFGIEVLRIAVGLIGLSLIIPTTALLSAWWFHRS